MVVVCVIVEVASCVVITQYQIGVEGFVKRLEHSPGKDGESAKDHSVDGDSLRGVLHAIDDAHDKGSKSLEEHKEPQDLEEFRRDAKGDQSERNIQDIVP